MTSDRESSLPPTEQGPEEVQTPTLISPPESKTPPTVAHKRTQGEIADDDGNSEPVDASVLSRALEAFEQAGKVRQRTPTSSPSRKRQRVYGDR
jgi:cell division cycle 20-like protein 1 (cofactor of APC complex)